MRTRFLLAAVCCLIGSMLWSCDKAKGETAKVEIDKEKIKAEIIAIESAYADALNIGNAEEASKYFADDAQSYHNGEAPLIGKQAITESLKQDVEAIPQGSKVSFVTNEVMISSDGNQVVEKGEYRVSNSSNPGMYSGNFISVFEKRDGSYVCVREMAVSDQPKN